MRESRRGSPPGPLPYSQPGGRHRQAHPVGEPVGPGQRHQALIGFRADVQADAQAHHRATDGETHHHRQAEPEAHPQKPNPYTATGVCGSGYKVVNSRALGGVATIYLLYNSAAGKNCVVTMSRYVVPAKVAMNAILQVQGGSSGSNPGRFTVYAGPVRLSAAKKCVIWGGSHGSLSWKSGWSHCG